MADELTLGSFADHVGEPFPVAGDGGPVLELSGVRRHPAQPGAPRAEPFSLEFLGPSDSPIGEGVHALRHPALGDVEIFLVPLGPGRDGRLRYEAVFN